MGLDNFPMNYPCKTGGTAVMVSRRNEMGDVIIDPDTGDVMQQISCDQTQACGGCPYQNDFAASGLPGGAVHGIFGTDCWYRGKYGNWLLQEMGLGHEVSFYGDNDDESEKSPESCLLVANAISDFLDDEPRLELGGQDVTDDLKYAEWYLRWAAEKCGGLVAWY